MFSKCLLSVILLLCACSQIQSQEQDTSRVYKRIRIFAEKNKWTKMAYEAIFRDPKPEEYPVEPAGRPNRNVNPYLKYTSLPIRNIFIKVNDPFGYSVNDTNQTKINWHQKIGNDLHMKTRRFVIINRLLFKENDKVDALRISESERLLRAAPYVNDARITLWPNAKSDSVDVYVVVTDKWPVGLQGELTDMNGNAQFRNSNLFGSGQQFEQYAKLYRDMDYFVQGFYNVANISNTYISSRLGYSTKPTESNVYLSFDKPFYSFLATWAGGIYVYHTWRKFNFYDSLSDLTRQIPLNTLGYDLWAAKSIKLSDKKTLLNQSTNLIVGGRVFNNIFLNRPSMSIDTANNFLNNVGYVGNIGIAVQQYYKDRYIYRFGSNEDVPEGLLVQVIYGVLKRELNKIRYYNGIELAKAKHFSFGYFSATVSYGIFYNTNVPNDVTTNYNLQYFSELLKKGSWYFRQFFNYNLVHGENKIEKQTITLKPDDLYGFKSGNLQGNTKMVLNSETVCYLPYKLIGFKFAPVLMAGIGVIGDKQNYILNSRLYQGYSLGLMIRNENLLTSTIQISVGLYPYYPDHKGPVVEYNPVTSFTLRVRGFSLARPDFVAY